MATRDRTSLFVQYRSSFHAGAGSRRRGAGGLVGGSGGLRSGGGGGGGGREDDEATMGLIRNEASGADDDDPRRQFSIEMGNLPPRWMDIVDEIDDEMAKIKEKVSQVESLHKKNLLPGFDDRNEEEANIERLSDEIMMSFQICGKKIKRISEVQQQQATAQEQLVSKNIQTALATRLQELSGRFRKSQSNYLEKIRGHDVRGMELTATGGRKGPTGVVSFSGVEEPVSSFADEASSFQNMGFTEQQLGMVFQNEKVIGEREQEINEIVKSIHGLAEIFRDMQTLVIDQGTILDRIDYNIENVAVSMKTANEELVKGEKYQKKAQSKYCIIILGILIVFLLIVLMLKPKKS